MENDAVVILNAMAGAGAAGGERFDGARLTQLRAGFERGGLAVRVVTVKDGDEIAAAAGAALAAGVRRIVAGGGDGTVNAVAAQLIGADATLGVLPLGTLNHFARDLAIPLALEQAIQVIVDGHAVSVDVAQVNDRVFINNSGLGLYPEIVRERERQQSRLGRGKWPAFCWAALSALRRYPFLNVRLLVDGKLHARDTPFVFIGNNAYLMEGLNIGKRVRLDQGCLSLYVSQRPGRLGLLRLALRALFSQLDQARDFDVLSAREIAVKTRRRRLHVATDGEVTMMSTPLQYRILPAALKVNVPRPANRIEE